MSIVPFNLFLILVLLHIPVVRGGFLRSYQNIPCKLSSDTLCSEEFTRYKVSKRDKRKRDNGKKGKKTTQKWKRGNHEKIAKTVKSTSIEKESSDEGLPLCVGIAGNGQLLWAHFGALARIVETFGVVHGVAGGSSATITSFLLSSIQGNSGITECRGMCCAEEEQRARVSLLLKSTLALSEESNGIAFQEAIVPALLAIQEAQILERLQGGDSVEQAAAVAELLAILESEESAVQVINPDFISLLQTSPDPVSHAIDILKASSGDFNADNFRVFLRPYPISFLGVAQSADVVASFYKFAQFDEFLERCAALSFGRFWPEIRDMSVGPMGRTCGTMYDELYQQYLRQRKIPSQLQEPLGESMKTLIPVALLTGDAANVFRQAQNEYLNPATPGNPNALDPNEIIPVPSGFAVDFDDVKFGYFGDRVSLERVKKNIVHFGDPKSQRFVSLGQATWLDVLTTSPAEPTLSNGVDLGKVGISVAGWPDPIPSQVLHSMGCETVVLITDSGGKSKFATDVATLLNATPKDFDDLYSLSRPDSGWTVALQTAKAVLCSEWDPVPASDVERLIEAGYAGPLLTDDACILSASEADASDAQIVGCTPLTAPSVWGHPW